MKGYSTRRAREWRKMGHVPSEQTGKPNVAGWKQLAAKFGEMGYGVQQGGERLMQASA